MSTHSVPLVWASTPRMTATPADTSACRASGGAPGHGSTHPNRWAPHPSSGAPTAKPVADQITERTAGSLANHAPIPGSVPRAPTYDQTVSTEDHPRHVMVLAGGLTHEREISLRSGSRLADALRSVGHEVTVLEPNAELLPWLIQHQPDAAVIALHGGEGESGDIQSVLELMGIPYLGTSSRHCPLAFDKTIAKSIIHQAGLRTPPWITLAHSTFGDLGAKPVLAAVSERLGFPLMIKPNMGGSALGASVAATPYDLPSALVGAFSYGESALIERFIRGTELAVTVVQLDDTGPQVLPLVEIRPPGDILDYESHYTAGSTVYYSPPTITEDVTQSAVDLSLATFRLLSLRDIARIDILIDSSGSAHFLEATTSPGLTETSILNVAVARAGLSIGSLYSRLIGRLIEKGQQP